MIYFSAPTFLPDPAGNETINSNSWRIGRPPHDSVNGLFRLLARGIGRVWNLVPMMPFGDPAAFRMQI
jgi:hypothetical protein